MPWLARGQIDVVHIDAHRRNLVGIVLVGDGNAAHREIGLRRAEIGADLKVGHRLRQVGRIGHALGRQTLGRNRRDRQRHIHHRCARRCAVTTISPTAGADVGAAAGSWAAGASSAKAGFATIVAVASAARLANP
jgi:hypothetical protein